MLLSPLQFCRLQFEHVSQQHNASSIYRLECRCSWSLPDLGVMEETCERSSSWISRLPFTRRLLISIFGEGWHSKTAIHFSRRLCCDILSTLLPYLLTVSPLTNFSSSLRSTLKPMAGSSRRNCVERMPRNRKENSCVDWIYGGRQSIYIRGSGGLAGTLAEHDIFLWRRSDNKLSLNSPPKAGNVIGKWLSHQWRTSSISSPWSAWNATDLSSKSPRWLLKMR
jgi:hypothetical protein